MSATLEQEVILTRDPSIDASVDIDSSETVAVLAEYDTVDAVMAAADKVRKAGYSRWDVHSPFPIHGIDPIVGIKPTILPWIVLICGTTGMLTGLFLTHYTMATEIKALGQFAGYPYLISGKPLLSTPAYIPPIFELTILFSAFGAVFGMLLLNNLPMLYNPLFRNHRFKRATDDRFFVVIETSDPKYEEAQTVKLLRSTKPLALERVED
jgi:Protein of unknown function (DUF3341)